MADYGVDVLFLEGKSLLKPDLYYMTRFLTVDDFYFVKIRDQPGVIAALDMICERARKYSPIRQFHSVSATWNRAVSDRVPREELEFRVISDIRKQLLPESGVVGIPRHTDALRVHFLNKLGVQTQPVQTLFFDARETKDAAELKAIQRASEAVETTFRQIFDVIQNSEIGSKHQLIYKNHPLTVGYLKRVIEHSLVDNAAENSEESIVAGGVLSADYHYLGQRHDVLHAHEPIIIDIFPRRLEERYHADITRTIVRGSVPKKLKMLFESVESTLNTVIDTVTVGTTTETLVDAMADAFERNGHASANRTPEISEGMIHALGHGIGLDVHEFPQLSLQPIPLRSNSVIAVEPGLYYKRLGGVRIENDLVVTNKGARSLTTLPMIVFL